MLQIKHLQVLRGQLQLNYDFQVTAGNIMAIRGVSGIGKTTLLDAIAGFVDITRGEIIWQNQEIQQLSSANRPVSMMFQDHNLFEHLTIDENIHLGLTTKTWVAQALRQLNLTNQLRKFPSELSGGQRQRIALIRTILRPEPIVLLDEPFSELDSETRLQVIQWAKTMLKKQSKTTLLVTHQTEDIEQIADATINL